MELSDIQNLIPLGGASVLLIYLLRLIQYERSRWIRERATLLQECRDVIAEKNAEMDRRAAEQDRFVAAIVKQSERREAEHTQYVEQLQASYALLRADFDRLLERHNELAQERAHDDRPSTD